ncbi:hypothetical protein ACFXMT_14270 [Streptomyces mirabilis]|uniref:hypothetical protein n=1 Tax=Streptomyces mirabilis TaxID=68239 RepID=UPI003693305A
MPTKNDATGAAHSVDFNGDTYLVPPADDWDLDVLEAIDDQRLTHALKALLGAEQYTKFRVTNRKVADLGKFFEVAGKSVGAGNS